MIQSVSIKNFILIDELSISLSGGFNVFTGETGAGKSIIISAIDIALGSKANKDLIKQNEEKAFIELTIKLDNKFDRKNLENNGIEIDSDELVISREISQTTTRSRINGVLVTQEFVKEIREQLLDIHTQHQSYNYMQPKMHIKLLDNFGCFEHQELLSKFNKLYLEYAETKRHLQNALNSSSSTEKQIEFLKFQIQEIEYAAIEDIEEDSKLKNNLDILLNSEKLKELSYSSYWALYENEQNIISSLGSVKTNLSKLSQLDNNTRELEEQLANSLEILKDLAINLRNYSEKQEMNEEQINIIQERMDILDKLKRKYGNTLDGILITYNALSKELNSIEFSQDEVIRLESKLKEQEIILNDIAQRLSNSRKQLATNLSILITEEMEKLELPKSQFSIDIQPQNINENGIDKVEFLITTNVSEPLRPLIKVASGGEISRIMLAVKTIFAKADETNTVIFDEIDTGVSGKASQSVADAIVNLSKYHQIILITHQPIIAAKADCHIYVKKLQEDETKVRVYNLEGENRIKALALLASGEINDESINFARGLIGLQNV